MFPNQTPQQPQQPAPVPQPIVTPPVPVEPPVALPPTPPQKKGSKKLIIILAVILVLLGLAAAVVFVVLPMLTSKTTGGNKTDTTTANTAGGFELTTKTAPGFSIDIPSTFKADTTTTGAPIDYSADGTESVTVPGVIVLTYEGAAIDSVFQVYSNPIADTVNTKSYTVEKLTYQGFEAVRGKGTTLQDGQEVYTSNIFAVKTPKTLYLVSVNVPVGDTSGIADNVDKIFNSLAIQ